MNVARCKHSGFLSAHADERMLTGADVNASSNVRNDET